MPLETPDRHQVLGTGISCINLDQTVGILEAWIREGGREYVCVATVHSVLEASKNPVLADAMNASGLTTPDGMPLVWLSRKAGNRTVERVYGPDLMLAFFERSVSKGYKHYFLGGRDGVPEELEKRMKARFEGLQIVGSHSPPFRALTLDEEAQTIQNINDVSPDIVWVGLGAPKQELWMAKHRRALHAPVLVGVGAAFDFHSATKRQAPKWMQRNGLEWFFRLASEPRRLWRRYLLGNAEFLVRLMKEAIH